MGRPRKVVAEVETPEMGAVPTFVEPVQEMYADKCIVSKKMVDINGKTYCELSLEDGSTVLQ